MLAGVLLITFIIIANFFVPKLMSKIFLKVPFPEKDEVKSKGGKFDAENKLWYCFSENLELFSPRWPVFINCPFSEKDDAKRKGAIFDGDKKMWYINPGINLNSFAKWLPHDSIRDKPQESSSKDFHKKEDKYGDTSALLESSTRKIENEVKDSVQNSSKKKQKNERKEESLVTNVNINVQVNSIPSINKPSSAEAANSTAELSKIKGTIKDGCSFDVATLKDLLKERGVKGLSKLSKQQLIDQCIDLKLLKPVLQLQTQPSSQPQPTLPVSDSYEKKRKSEKDIAYF